MALDDNSLIKGRWKLSKKIGQGAFGQIFCAKNIITNDNVAIKVEKVDAKKQVLKQEVAVIRKLQDCSYVCRFVTCGRYNNYNFMVLELLGDNLSDLRRKQPQGKFSLLTALKLVMPIIRSIQGIHKLGFLHRDVKPSNFVMGLGDRKREVFVIDFGLAKRYTDLDGNVRPARENTGFRGTARYASINSHQCKDLGRRDDMWSVFYILVEFVSGALPWRSLKDKDQIGELKIKYNTPELVQTLPHEFLSFMDHLQSLKYESAPDYDYLYGLLEDLYKKKGGTDATLYDWEKDAAPKGNALLSPSPRPLDKSRMVMSSARTNDSKTGRLVLTKEFGTAESAEADPLKHRTLQSTQVRVISNRVGANKDLSSATADTDAPVGSDVGDSPLDLDKEGGSGEGSAMASLQDPNDTPRPEKSDAQKEIDAISLEESNSINPNGFKSGDTPKPANGKEMEVQGPNKTSRRNKIPCCALL